MRAATTIGFVALLALSCLGHDIPNARVDRATQVTLRPGRIEVDYEVSLSELTLTQDLRSLVGTLPGGDRDAWFDLYGRETGPLNAKGFLVDVDDESVALETAGFDVHVEQHPRFVFHFAASIPPSGHLKLKDINFVSSEGTSKLAVRGREGVEVPGDGVPEDIDRVPARPVWEMSDAEERRTNEVEVVYRMGDQVGAVADVPSAARPAASSTTLSGLLGGMPGVPMIALAFLAFGLGAIHALQPGHGKTLVAATVVSGPGAWWRGVVLALVTTATHFASVLMVAAALWATRSARYAEWDRILVQVAGFLIAAIALWRLGRSLAGVADHEHAELRPGRDAGLIGIGLAAGIVPCWDAITLVILAEALGRLGLALGLLAGFSLGMAAVLVVVGWLAGKVRGAMGGRWPRRLGLAGSLVVTAIGVYLLSQ
jgi:ABC-type nickel/cobalt efflux system permease component RcnA